VVSWIQGPICLAVEFYPVENVLRTRTGRLKGRSLRPRVDLS
jgi:hypothetical protein